MAKNSILFLSTVNFPYYDGEWFICNEIETLSKNFDKVIILLNKVKGEKMVMNFPLNVEVRCLTSTRNHSKLYFCKYLLSPKEILKRRLNFKKNTNYIYSRIFIKNFEENFEQIILKESFDYKEVYLYSYWHYSHVVAMANIKNILEKNGKKCKVFSRGHRADIFHDASCNNGYIPYEKDKIKCVDKLFVVSNYNKTYMCKRFPEYADKIITSYLGTYDYGIQPYKDSKTILSCSYIVSVKRLNLIIDALSILYSKGIKFNWVHIGDGKLKDEVEQYAKQKLPVDSFKFEGYKNNLDVMKYYKNAETRLFINVSESEGLPVTMQEAISFGIPIVGLNVGGCSDIILNNLTGLLLDNLEDKECLIKNIAEAISTLLNMKNQKYYNLRKSCRDIWEEKFSAQKNYSEFCDLLKKI